MNRVYRLVWSGRLGSVIVAAETARGRGKAAGLTVIPALLLSAIALTAQALPQGGAVSQGTGSMATTGNTMTVTQTSQNMAIEWQRFNTSAVESVVFVQPNAQAIALNRVIGNESSTLLGSLAANGQVWLLNSNGILIGQGATVNVGGLVTSTLFISDADFMNGNRVFRGTGGSVVNRGTITVGTNGDGGYVAMMGGTVSNEGVITARLGTVAMAGGSQITLNFNGDKLLSAQVDRSVVNALVQNKQLISADGGTVIMTAQGANALLSTVVNNEGTIEARTLSGQKGRMLLGAGAGGTDGGTISVSGKLDASASGTVGGTIEVSGPYVKINDGAVITTAASGGTTGQLLVTASGFTVGASGAAPTSGMSAATLSNHLALNHVRIKTAAFGSSGVGDIDINAPLTWTSNHSLAFEAARHVNVNAPISNSGSTAVLALTAARNINVNANVSANGATASLTMAPGTSAGDGYKLKRGVQINLQSGANLVIAGKTYKVINSLDALQGMRDDLSGNYALGSNIDATASKDLNSGAGFVPVGRTSTASFSGMLDGLGHQVSKLFIFETAVDNTGLVGYNTGTVQNIGLADVDITGRLSTGALVGRNASGTISNVAVSGTVKSFSDYVGGLVGYNDTGSISGASVSGKVEGTLGNVGGLVGYHSAGTIRGAMVTGVVSGGRYTGGLVGANDTGSMMDASVSATVTGTTYVGGLVGYNNSGILRSAIFSGGITSNLTDNNTGGLVGADNSGRVSNAYATGTLNTSPLQALIGVNTGTDPVEVGAFDAADMKKQENFRYFDFSDTWRIYQDHTTPLLKAFLKPVTVNADNATKIYDGKTYTDAITGVTNSAGANLNGTLIFGSAAQPAVDAGTHGLGGLWSTAYDISYGSGSLKINPRTLTAATQNPVSKVYDGTTDAWLVLDPNSLSGFVDGQAITVLNSNLTGTYNSKNVSEAKTVAVGLGGNNFGPAFGTRLANYELLVNGAITPAPLVVKAVDVAKTYNGAAFTGGALSYHGFVAGETETTATLPATLTYSGTAQGAKNAGSYTITPGGLLAANYSVEFVSGRLTINPKALTISAPALTSKVYDGTTTATLALGNRTLTGVVEGESVTAKSATITGAYNSKNVGEAKTVAVALSESSFDAGSGTQLSNYTVTEVNGEITHATLNVVAGNVSKVYDGMVFGGGSPLTYQGFVNGETETTAGLIGTLNYGGSAQGAKNAGSYAITPGGDLLAANYNVEFVSGILTINPKALTLSTPVPTSKIYDGTIHATLAVGSNALSGFVDGESVTLANSNLTGVYNSKNVGEAKTVTVSLGAENFNAAPGTELANYHLLVNGEITRAALTVKAVDLSKTYSGAAFSGSGQITYLGLVNGETDTTAGLIGTLTHSGSAQGAKNVGSYVMTPGGLSATNYNVGFVSGTLKINPKELIASTTGTPTKVYDGTTAAVLTLKDPKLAGVVDGESVTAKSLTLTGVYNSKNVNDAKTVAVALNESSFEAGPTTQLSNYQLTAVKGDITQAALLATARDASKKFDGTAYSGGNGLSYRGFVGGDTSAVISGTPIYSGASQGAKRPGSYAIMAQGVTAANYKVGFAAGMLVIEPYLFNASLSGMSPQVLASQRKLPRATNNRLRLADPRLPPEGTECKNLVKRSRVMQCVDAATPPLSQLPQLPQLPVSDAVPPVAGNDCKTCIRQSPKP